MKKRLKKIVTTVKKVGTLNLVLMFVGAFFIWFNWQMILLYRQCDSMPETYACAVCGSNHWRVWHMRLDPDKQRQTAGSEMGKRGQEETGTKRRQYGRK